MQPVRSRMELSLFPPSFHQLHLRRDGSCCEPNAIHFRWTSTSTITNDIENVSRSHEMRSVHQMLGFIILLHQQLLFTTARITIHASGSVAASRNTFPTFTITSSPQLGSSLSRAPTQLLKVANPFTNTVFNSKSSKNRSRRKIR